MTDGINACIGQDIWKCDTNGLYYVGIIFSVILQDDSDGSIVLRHLVLCCRQFDEDKGVIEKHTAEKVCTKVTDILKEFCGRDMPLNKIRVITDGASNNNGFIKVGMKSVKCSTHNIAVLITVLF